MKILKLQGENFKKMKAFDITPNGHTVVLSGANGAGKSSVLDAITLLFAGKSSEAAKLTTKPIHSGAKRAHVTADIGDYIVTRTWTEKDSYLEVTSREGAAYKSPQDLLNKIIGELSFDPMQFARMTPAEQKKALLSIVKLSIDLDKWQSEYDEKYERRKVVKKDVERAKVLFEQIPAAPAGVPAQEVSVTDLMANLEQAQKDNHLIETLELAEKTNTLRIAELEAELADRRATLVKVQDTLKKAPPKVDLTVIQGQIKSADTINQQVRSEQTRKERKAEFERIDGDRAALESDLAAMKKQKEDALLKASYPVPGLSLSDDGVTFVQDGEAIPFGQLSTALQTKISMAMAMAANPSLKVIRISDGSLLDETTMKAIEEMALKNDYQIWIEKVDTTGKVGIFIEDGEIAANNDSPVAA